VCQACGNSLLDETRHHVECNHVEFEAQSATARPPFLHKKHRFFSSSLPQQKKINIKFENRQSHKGNKKTKSFQLCFCFEVLPLMAEYDGYETESVFDYTLNQKPTKPTVSAKVKPAVTLDMEHFIANIGNKRKTSISKASEECTKHPKNTAVKHPKTPERVFHTMNSSKSVVDTKLPSRQPTFIPNFLHSLLPPRDESTLSKPTKQLLAMPPVTKATPLMVTSAAQTAILQMPSFEHPQTPALNQKIPDPVLSQQQELAALQPLEDSTRATEPFEPKLQPAKLQEPDVPKTLAPALQQEAPALKLMEDPALKQESLALTLMEAPVRKQESPTLPMAPLALKPMEAPPALKQESSLELKQESLLELKQDAPTGEQCEVLKPSQHQFPSSPVDAHEEDLASHMDEKMQISKLPLMSFMLMMASMKQQQESKLQELKVVESSKQAESPFNFRTDCKLKLHRMQRKSPSLRLNSDLKLKVKRFVSDWESMYQRPGQFSMAQIEEDCARETRQLLKAIKVLDDVMYEQIWDVEPLTPAPEVVSMPPSPAIAIVATSKSGAVDFILLGGALALFIIGFMVC
jgi:hypothetical protein